MAPEAADDILVKGGRRFEVELATTPGLERAISVISEQWRAVGVSVKQRVLALNAQADRQVRASFGGIELAAGPPACLSSKPASQREYPRARQSYAGGNRGALHEPADRFVARPALGDARPKGARGGGARDRQDHVQ